MAGRGEAGHGLAKLSKARVLPNNLTRAWLGQAWPGKARQGDARLGKARQGFYQTRINMSNTRRNFKNKLIKDKDTKNIRQDRSCNNNGSCPICKRDRTYSTKHREAPDEQDIP